MLFVFPKTSFKPACSLFGYDLGHLFSLFFVFPGLAFSYKIGFDIVFCCKAPVLVCSIDGIGTCNIRFGFGQFTGIKYCSTKACSFIKRIEIKMLDEVYSIYLQFIYLGAKLNFFGFFSPYYWTYITFGKTYYAILYFLTRFKLILLLFQNFGYYLFFVPIFLGHLQLVLLFYESQL